MKWKVNLTVLTGAQLDMFKLAMMDLGSVSPGIAGSLYMTGDDKHYGAVFAAWVDAQACSGKDMGRDVGAALQKRGVEYLSMTVHCVEAGQLTLRGFVDSGNIPRERTSAGPYRDKATTP